MAAPGVHELERLPECPRCGYDQAGHIATWSTACPVRGECSECGLQFNWADVLSEQRRLLPGFVEHARGVRQRFLWAWVTWSWTLIPNRFWSRVRMHHAPRNRRALVWLVIVTACVYIPGALLRNIAVFGSAFLTIPQTGWGPITKRWPELVAPWGEPFVGLQWSNSAPGGLTVALLTDLESFGLFGGVLAAPLLFPVVFACLPVTRARAKVRTAHLVRATIYSLAWVPVALLYRVAAGILELVDPSTGPWWSGRSRLGYSLEAYFHEFAWAWVLALVLWTCWWWYQAIKRGFELPQPRRHFVLMLVPALLGALIVLLSTHNMSRWLMNLV
ncbi:MAG: hypothetical protein H7Y88_13195 [Phycisphaerales bacterium]|nr:hypothetical protein [Phycisphaerales bacterium]